MLLPLAQLCDNSDDWIKLKAKFKNDNTRRFILNDPTLCAWGRNQCLKYGSSQEKHIRDRLRTVGTFCLQYHTQFGTSDFYIKDILKTSNFSKNFNVAKVAYGTALTPPTRLGPYLKELVMVLKHTAIFANDMERKTHLDNLFFLIESRWTLISAPNIRMLKDQKPKVVEMPITNDIKTFLSYLSIEINIYIEKLTDCKPK